jgi:hypothetical protein
MKDPNKNCLCRQTLQILWLVFFEYFLVSSFTSTEVDGMPHVSAADQQITRRHHAYRSEGSFFDAFFFIEIFARQENQLMMLGSTTIDESYLFSSRRSIVKEASKVASEYV